MSVHLLIKSPNQEVDDIEVNCDSEWSVGQLKDHLHSAYPTRPKQSQQKIIYGGKVLPDHLLLKDVLTKNLDIHTMHLVCPQSTYSSSSSSNNASVKLEQDKHASPELQNIIPTVVQDDGLRQRFWSAQNNQFNMPATYLQGPVPQVGVAPMSYQFAVMQQTYAQIMAQFLAQNQPLYQNAAMQPPPAPSPAQPVPEPVEHVANRPQIPHPAVRNADRREERDLLDTLYILSRLFVLCMVVYFYSTPGKVMLVAFFGLLICVFRTFGSTRPYHRPNLQTRQDRPNNRTNADQVPTETVGNHNEEMGNNQENTGAEDASSSTSASESSDLPTGNGFSFITFVQAFFTSLIPEPPVPVET